jgi:hypothetical protein
MGVHYRQAAGPTEGASVCARAALPDPPFSAGALRLRASTGVEPYPPCWVEDGVRGQHRPGHGRSEGSLKHHIPARCRGHAADAPQFGTPPETSHERGRERLRSYNERSATRGCSARRRRGRRRARLGLAKLRTRAPQLRWGGAGGASRDGGAGARGQHRGRKLRRSSGGAGASGGAGRGGAITPAGPPAGAGGGPCRCSVRLRRR